MKVLLLGSTEENPLISQLENFGEEIIYKTDKVSFSEIRSINPDFIISYNYRHIIDKGVIEKYKNTIINLHISLLPWNKGAHPNFWSFWDETPKGITIHFIDEGIDTGSIIVQKELQFDEIETLKSTYEKLQEEIQKLLIEHWSDIKNHRVSCISQNHSGTFHYSKDINKIWSQIEAKGGWNITIRDLIDLKKDLK